MNSNIEEAFAITPDKCKLKPIFQSKTMPKSVVTDSFRTLWLIEYENLKGYLIRKNLMNAGFG